MEARMTPRRYLATRSVPLAEDTMEAWRQCGVVFRRRNRHMVWDTRYHEPHIEAVINLGNLDMDFSNVPVPVFNAPETIRAISSPMALSRTLPHFTPEATHQGPHWHKTNGYGGVGKAFVEDMVGHCAVVGGAAQKHIEGIEYRVISVGNAVVQASRKHGEAPDFEYEWIGVKGVSTNGTIPLIHEALQHVPKERYSLIGWDVIVGDNGPWIIEANTSPGVNEPTARRIMDMIEEII